jgi:hypothetical protein
MESLALLDRLRLGLVGMEALFMFVKSTVQLESLVLLDRLGQVETEALITFVESAIHLKKLSIDVSEQDENFPAALEEALRENGSLVNVCGGLMRTYSERNANLRLLLQQEPMPSADLSLVPSLFQAAKAAKKMAANIIYTIVLMDFDHLDDPRQGQLRMRPALD